MANHDTKTDKHQPQVSSPMSPAEALIVLDQASSLAMLNRADHIRVNMAIQTIRAFIENSKLSHEQGSNAK